MIEHLQINDVAPCVHYDADGVQAAFIFPFAVFKVADLEVWVNKVRVISGFGVSGAGISSGGAVLFTVPPAAGARVTLRRRMALERISDFQTDGIIRAKTLNDELDYQVAAVQQVADDVARCVRRPFTSGSTADLSLPDPVPGRSLKWNAGGTALTNSDYDPDAPVAASAAFADAAASSASAATGAASAAAASASAAEGHESVARSWSVQAGESAAAAATLAATFNLPGAAGHGLGYLRQKAAADGFEYRTPAQVLADIGGQSAADVQARIAGLDATLQNVRDQGVLTALRQMLNTSVGTGALVRGKQWELSTDEWGASSTGESYVAGAISYYTQAGGADTTFSSGSGTYTVPAGASTLLVRMWGGGGGGSPGPATFGQGGGGGGFYMATLTVNPGQSFSYSVGAGGSPGVSGGNSIFNGVTARGGGAGGSGTTLANAGAGPTEAGQQGLWSGSQAANSRAGGNAGGMAYGGGAGGGNAAGNPSAGYAGSAPGGGGGGGSSSQDGGSGGAGAAGRIVITPVYAMTLSVPASVTINSAPAYADLFFLWKDDSGTGLTAPAGTIRLSRDGGVTKAPATVTVEAALDSTYSIIRARADVSGQPSGTSLWADIDFGVVKQRFAAPAILGE